MKILVAQPPNFEAVAAVFPEARNRGVIFTWGDTIYNPNGVEISPSLKAHEGVHFSRQTNDPAKIAAWWDTYLVDPEFRISEELPAHRAEFKAFCVHHKDRNHQSQMRRAIAGRFAGPLYGGLMDPAKARRLIAA